MSGSIYTPELFILDKFCGGGKIPSLAAKGGIALHGEWPDFNRLPGGETLLRRAGFLLFVLLLAARVGILGSYGSDAMRTEHPAIFYSYRLLWLLESVLFLIYAWAYAFRKPAISLASGLRETALPLLAAATPFLMIRHGFLSRLVPGYGRPFQDLTRLNWGGREMGILQVDVSPIPLAAALGVMLAGTALMVAGALYLGESFSIMCEVRKIVTAGPYGLIRHPLYAGEMIAYLGVLMLRFSLANLAIYACFIVLQAIRAGAEEKKLRETFPEYEEYMKRTGTFFPGIGKRPQPAFFGQRRDGQETVKKIDAPPA
jgi:protein-S-isoprenylcysteine O-methyltransferase Ste14